MRIVLASGSPRRRELLQRLGVEFDVVPSNVPEPDAPLGADPTEYARLLARAKAGAVAASHPDRVVLAADTVVATESDVLGKPVDDEDALRMLRLLRGRSHQVVTAVAVYCGQLTVVSEAARVTMKPSSDQELRNYIASGEPMDKAGAYAVQGLGGTLVDRVEGCYETVVGLPLCRVRDLLTGCGVPVPGDATCRHG